MYTAGVTYKAVINSNFYHIFKIIFEMDTDIAIQLKDKVDLLEHKQENKTFLRQCWNAQNNEINILSV